MHHLETEGIHNPRHAPRRAMPLRTGLRALRLVLHLSYALLLAACYPALPLAVRQAITRRWSADLLKIMHVRLEFHGALPRQDCQGALLVTNHISWLDVFAINAVAPSTFIAKSEVRTWPLVGLLCSRGQTLFIDRSKRRDTLHANRAIAARLLCKENIALFPEGTTTGGAEVRHFHSSLLQCAIDAGSLVVPVALRYHDGNGHLCMDAAYIDDMTLPQSLYNVLCSGSLHVTVIALPHLETAALPDRRSLAAHAHAAISSALEKTPTHVRPINGAPSPVPCSHLNALAGGMALPRRHLQRN